MSKVFSTVLAVGLAGGMLYAAESFTAGKSFEDPAVGGVKAWGGAKAVYSADWAADGKQSLKVTMTAKDAGVTIDCTETDWSKYTQLRITLHNPDKLEKLSSRTVYIDGKPLDGKSKPAWGSVRIPSAGTSTAIIDLKTLPKNIDLKNIKKIVIYKGTPNVSFYVDSIRLCTPEDVAKLTAEAERAKGSLVSGMDFENALSIERAKASGGATVSLEKGKGVASSQALKMYFANKESLVAFTPDITDWTPYKELRFTIHNPQPQPYTKYRVLYINSVPLGKTSKPAWGSIVVPPETSKEFVVDIASLPEKIDRKNIKRIQFYKGQADTTFYIDNLKLYTQQELDDLKFKKKISKIDKPLAAVQKALQKKLPAELTATLQGYAATLQKLRSQLPEEFSSEQLRLMQYAMESAMLAESAAQYPGKKLLLGGADAALKIFRDEPLVPLKERTDISAAGNEAESFQIVVLPFQKLQGVTVTAGALVNAQTNTVLPAENIIINPVGYVEVPASFYYASSRTGFWPDVLHSNKVLDLAGKLQSYYVTVRVPANQQPGIYKGSIKFSGKNFETQEYFYSVKVRNFSLPVGNTLLTFTDFRYNPKDPVIRRKCYDTLFDYRMQPVSMYINGKAPATAKSYQFVPHLDDLDYCIKRGQNFFCIWYIWNSAKPYYFDDAYRKKLADFVNYARPIFEKKGIWDKCVINGFDEVMHGSNIEVKLANSRELCAWIKNTLGKDVKISNVGKLMNISPELMDHYFTIGQHPETFKHITAAGKTVSFYWVYDDPSFMLDLPGVAPRMLAWQAFKYNAGGLGYYSTYRPWALNCPAEKIPSDTDWTSDIINIDSFASKKSKGSDKRLGRAGDGNLFYPAPDGSIMPSVRTANYRDGMEDYEYLALLKKLDPNHALLQIPDQIVMLATGGYTHDLQELATYREKLAAAIEKLSAR